MQVLKEYREWLEGTGRKQNTITAYLSRIDNFLQNVGPNVKINQDLVDLYFKNNSQLKSTTKSQTVAAIRNYLDFLGVNESIKSVKVVHSHTQIAYMEQNNFDIESVLGCARLIGQKHRSNAAVISIRNRAIIAILYWTGMRVGELHGLKMSDIDFESKTIFVREAKNGPRQIHICSKLVPYIDKYYKIRSLMKHEGEHFLASHGKNSSGQHMSYGALRQVVKAVLKESGHKNLSCHVFRRCFVTNLIKSGAYLNEIKAVAGHSSYGDLDHYFIGEKSVIEAMEEIA